MIRAALAGTPNVGKSTLFNALTGGRQRVGNWPGVTVERKIGRFVAADEEVEITDLPGISDLSEDQGSPALDQSIASSYLASAKPDLVVCILDATLLNRGLYLTTQLLQMQLPLVVALNMSDLAQREGLKINTRRLAKRLGCEVVSVTASQGKGVGELKAAILRKARESKSADHVKATTTARTTRFKAPNADERYRVVDLLLADVVKGGRKGLNLTDVLDSVLLNPIFALPIFLFVVYLMFVVTIGVGGAFIDLFDGVGSAIFVEGPRTLLNGLGLPAFLVAFLSDGVGGGVQLVATFIPIIGTLFLCLSVLESSGYMARAAFLMDRLLRQAGLPGHAFLPLIVGFGCNVPAVMATRALPCSSERVLSALMAPYMSCGARLTVYALFAAAFFRGYAAEIVFLLYVMGIAVAIVTVLLMRRKLVAHQSSGFVLEMPAYHLPRLGNILRVAWHRLRDFVIRAGKAIVLVVIALNLLNSWGTDGSFGNENTEASVLSAIGKSITPVLEPMGVEEENWPAAVGLFTGMFAKEVVVGTFDALYSGPEEVDEGEFDLWQSLRDAAATVPANLRGLDESATDPLALDQVTKSAEGVELTGKATTVERLRSSFSGDLAAFSYLMFILLYIPCVATVGVLYRELGGFWAVFSVAWSLTLAYSLAVICYQAGSFAAHPVESLLWIGGMGSLVSLVYFGFVQWGLRRGVDRRDLIPLREVG